MVTKIDGTLGVITPAVVFPGSPSGSITLTAPVGSGTYNIQFPASNGQVILANSNGAIVLANSGGGSVTLEPAPGTSTTTFTFPNSSGTAGYVLTTNGSGATSWAPAAASGVTTFSGGTTGLTPAIATSGAITLGGTLAVANGGTGVTTSTGSGSVVLSTSPILVTPSLGIPASGTLTNCTGLPLATGVTGTLAVGNGGTGVTSSTGFGSLVLSTSPSLVTPDIGTPSNGTLTNCTGLPLTTGVTGILSAVNGGTGQSAYTIGDLLYASSTTALSKLPDAATGNALISGGVGAPPSWGKVGLTTHVSGTLPVANGGTGVTTLPALQAAVLPSQGGNAGKYLKTDGSTSSWGSINNPVNILDFGAVSDALIVNGPGPTTNAVSINAGSNVLTITGVTFSANDVGKSISVGGVGALPIIAGNKDPNAAGNGTITNLAALPGILLGTYFVDFTSATDFTVTFERQVTLGTGTLSTTPGSTTTFNTGDQVQFTLTAGSSSFASGTYFVIGAIFNPLITTISSLVPGNSSQVVLANAAVYTPAEIASQVVVWGTNNRTAIQAAINSSTSAVYVPAGSYLINNFLTMQAGQTLYGDGFNSRIMQIAPSVDAIRTGDAGTVHDLRITMPAANNTAFARAVLINDCDNVIVKSNWIEGGDNGVAGVAATNSKNFSILDNIIYGNKWSARVAAFSYGAGSADIGVGNFTFNGIVKGNYCLSNNSQGVSWAPNGIDADFIIANNIMVTLDPATCYPGGTWTEASNGGVRRHGIIISYNGSFLQGPKAVVSGNLIKNTLWTGIYQTSNAVRLNNGPCVISNNVIDHVGYDPVVTSLGGIFVSQSNGGTLVDANTITNYQGFVGGGILVTGQLIDTVGNTVVSNNIIKNSATVGISLTGTATKVVVRNNTLIENVGADISWYNTSGQTLGGGHTIAQNNIKRPIGSLTAAIDIDPSSCTVVNQIYDNVIEGGNNTAAYGVYFETAGNVSFQGYIENYDGGDPTTRLLYVNGQVKGTIAVGQVFSWGTGDTLTITSPSTIGNLGNLWNVTLSNGAAPNPGVVTFNSGISFQGQMTGTVPGTSRTVTVISQLIATTPIQIGTVLNWSTGVTFTVTNVVGSTLTGNVSDSAAVNPGPVFPNANNGAIRLRQEAARYALKGNRISNYYYGALYYSYQVATNRDVILADNQFINCNTGIFCASNILSPPNVRTIFTVPAVNNTFDNVTSPIATSGVYTVARVCQRLGNTFIIDSALSDLALSSGIPTRGQWEAGDKIFYSTQSAGNYIGALCTVSGTPTTLNGGATTASWTGSVTPTNTITVNSATNLWANSFIDIFGALPTGSRKVTAVVGTTVTVTPALTNDGVSAAVSYTVPVWQKFGAITLSGSISPFAPSPINTGTSITQDITVTGAAVNDIVSYISFTQDLQGLIVTAWVQATDTVRVRLQNLTAGNITLTSGVLTVNVIKA